MQPWLARRPISAPTLATAIAIGEWLEKTILRLFETVGLDVFSKAELMVLKIVRERQRFRGARYSKWFPSAELTANYLAMF